MKKLIVYICILSGFSVLVITAVHGATVVERRGRVHIEDLQNELWDVSQAKTLGFVPEKFQYGFGRDAFVPLDNSHLKSKHSLTVSNPKVIGIANENEAHAYSIERMKMHEIANTVFDGSPIAAAY